MFSLCWCPSLRRATTSCRKRPWHHQLWRRFPRCGAAVLRRQRVAAGGRPVWLSHLWTKLRQRRKPFDSWTSALKRPALRLLLLRSHLQLQAFDASPPADGASRREPRRPPASEPEHATCGGPRLPRSSGGGSHDDSDRTASLLHVASWR